MNFATPKDEIEQFVSNLYGKTINGIAENLYTI